MEEYVGEIDDGGQLLIILCGSWTKMRRSKELKKDQQRSKIEVDDVKNRKKVGAVGRMV